MSAAIAEYLAIREAPPGAHPAEFLCAEFFAEGDTDNESVFDQMGLDDDDERDRLFELLADVAGY